MRYISSLILLLFVTVSFAQTVDSTHVHATDTTVKHVDDSRIRISILTCGVGDELYSSFGHNGVRIIDSAKGLDEVYNYGTFSFSDPDFYVKFLRGKLMYYLSKSSYNNFIDTYIEEKRNIQEQVINLTPAQKQEMIKLLEHNARPENREYKYDFFMDNCATRIRDLFPKVLGPEFYFGETIGNKKISYRGIMNHYLITKHWERLGVNLLLGSRIDSIMTDDGIMFLPDYVHKGLVHARYKGEHVVAQDIDILKHDQPKVSTFNGPLWMMIGILILTVLSFLVPAFRYLKPIMRFLVLFSTGLLGCIMLFMWVGTNHLACSDNYNILWAVPLNIVVAFVANKRRVWLKIYALAAISLLIVGLVINAIGIQQLPLIEISPMLLCLMYIYIDMYKQNAHLSVATTPNTPTNTPTTAN